MELRPKPRPCFKGRRRNEKGEERKEVAGEGCSKVSLWSFTYRRVHLHSVPDPNAGRPKLDNLGCRRPRTNPQT